MNYLPNYLLLKLTSSNSRISTGHILNNKLNWIKTATQLGINWDNDYLKIKKTLKDNLICRAVYISEEKSTGSHH